MRLQSKISLESRTFELFRLVKRYTSSVDTFTALSGRRQKKRPELKLAVYLNDPCQGALAIQERERREKFLILTGLALTLVICHWLTIFSLFITRHLYNTFRMFGKKYTTTLNCSAQYTKQTPYGEVLTPMYRIGKYVQVMGYCFRGSRSLRDK